MGAGVLLAAATLAVAGIPATYLTGAPALSVAGMSVAASASPRGVTIAGPQQTAPQSTGEVIVEIRFRGNYSIADETLMEATGVTPGDPIEADTLAQITQRLRDTDGIGEVEVLKRYRSMSNTRDVVLLVNIKEHVAVREKFMFLPVFTWTDEYGITFGARFTTVDLLGLDERLSFPVTWGGDRSVAAEIGFDVDRAALTRVRGGFGISQRENPHFEVRDRRYGAWVDAMKRWEMFEVGARAEGINIDFGDTEDNQLEVGVRAAVDTRQDAQMPRNAFYIGGAWDHLRLFESDQWFNRLTADLRGYKSFIGRSIIATQAYYRSADGRLPDWERPFLGGAQTVRGYDAGAFIGDNIVLLSTELRVPITPPVPVGLVGLNFFFDSGTVYDWGTSIRKARFKNGVGGGIYFFVAFVGLQVDVAYGFQSEEVHFHFSTGFRF